jgi:CRP/FNR family transcriptional regulator
MTKFKKEGIISVKNHEVKILNEEALYMIVETNTIKDCSNCIAQFKESMDCRKGSA